MLPPLILIFHLLIMMIVALVLISVHMKRVCGLDTGNKSR